VPAHTTDLGWPAALRSQARIQAYGQGTAEKGYAGPVVVCSVSYEPIAGHRPYPLLKYLSEGREIEMALAPVAGTRLLAPFRMLVESVLANLVIEANQFEVTAQPQDTSTVADPGVGHQPRDRQDARPRCTAIAARP